MTENEKIIEEANEIAKGRMYATNEVIRLQKELEQYRAIGTVEEIQSKLDAYKELGTMEELKALKEKSVAKKPIERKRNYLTVFDCPTCNAELYSGQRFCDECGQSILDDYE